MEASAKSLSQLSVISDEELGPDCSEEMDRAVDLAHINTIRFNDGTETLCEYINESHYSKGGVIVQFINTNCAGSASLIGGIRIGVVDIRLIPKYLSKWKSYLRLHGIKYLARQMIDTHCPVAAGEVLFPEDYGISFTLASLSDKGIKLNPCKRSEGPLFYCIYPGLNEAAVVNEQLDGSFELTHVVNAYIHLLPASGRRGAIIKKLAAEAMQGQGDYQDDTQGKKRRSESNVRPYISNRQAYLEKNAKEHESRMREKEIKIKELEQQLAQA